MNAVGSDKCQQEDINLDQHPQRGASASDLCVICTIRHYVQTALNQLAAKSRSGRYRLAKDS